MATVRESARQRVEVVLGDVFGRAERERLPSMGGIRAADTVGECRVVSDEHPIHVLGLTRGVEHPPDRDRRLEVKQDGFCILGVLNRGQESVVVAGLLQSNTHSDALSDGDEDSFECRICADVAVVIHDAFKILGFWLMIVL